MYLSFPCRPATQLHLLDKSRVTGLFCPLPGTVCAFMHTFINVKCITFSENEVLCTLSAVLSFANPLTSYLREIFHPYMWRCLIEKKKKRKRSWQLQVSIAWKDHDLFNQCFIYGHIT